ncbi:MAG: glycosyl-4,4'-diaponeurosporenoate acyltransferase [Sporolactobacillus sp.]|uniref:glycosyl-4,4'-diaponeurosporenoate acyltransferase CrtO family protein n=1 Tax=Sporolactobacillus sp. STSJ-5 TaxID=2965076 RepID=UPI00210697D0|nr:glycosyl-4,4'-diaponeurosporenoate acyltransferase [Sporolactobacillus sp. STSJ-5]MCQ2010929.1 glycosyl-4,4'-diaponeurosporenoate acyltransferase [Sporolactobacillus sp. STSJ-5]
MSIVKVLALVNNFIIFMIISLINTIISIKLPITIFQLDSWLFRERRWEKGGHFYQDWFNVKRWKSLLPELSDFLSFLFSKKQMKRSSPDYLYRFALETCRAELVHWCIMISSLLFTQWNHTGVSMLMIFIAVVCNLPYIMIQRYNRPRILSILANKKTNLNGNRINDLEVLHKDI